MRINNNGYITRKDSNRIEFLVKSYNYSATVHIGNVSLPKNMIGRRVVFKMEIVPEPKPNEKFKDLDKCRI